jgi:hypothetical protein
MAEVLQPGIAVGVWQSEVKENEFGRARRRDLAVGVLDRARAADGGIRADRQHSVLQRAQEELVVFDNEHVHGNFPASRPTLGGVLTASRRRVSNVLRPMSPCKAEWRPMGGFWRFSPKRVAAT